MQKEIILIRSVNPIVFLSFFSKAGELPAAGLYSLSHFLMLLFSALGTTAALICTAKAAKAYSRRIVRILTLLLWILEIAKILFNLQTGQAQNPNSWIPLYYCSLVLYAGLLSSLCRGRLQHTGDVFLATGSIVGGTAFLIMPLTSLSLYPALHFISFHSFILHSLMVYMGLMLLISGSVRLTRHDIFYYAPLVLVMCAAALIANHFLDANLMFVSKNYPGTFIEILYHLFPGAWFPIVMSLGQATLPFYIVYGIFRLFEKKQATPHQL